MNWWRKKVSPFEELLGITIGFVFGILLLSIIFWLIR